MLVTFFSFFDNAFFDNVVVDVNFFIDGFLGCNLSLEDGFFKCNFFGVTSFLLSRFILLATISLTIDLSNACRWWGLLPLSSIVLGRGGSSYLLAHY